MRAYRAFLIVLDGGHVLDQDHCWVQHLRCPRHACVQSVPRIVSSRVVIEVGVSLAGRAAEENVDLTSLFGELHLGQSGWRAEVALQKRLDLRLSNAGFG